MSLLFHRRTKRLKTPKTSSLNPVPRDVWARSLNNQTFMHSMSPTCMSTHAFPLPQTCPAQLHSFFVLLSVLSNYFPPIPLANAF